MTSRIIFLLCTLAAFGFFMFTMRRIFRVLSLGKAVRIPAQAGKRILITLAVAFGQTKMVRRPVAGVLHAVIWWGFLVITIGTAEMIIDGIAGTDRVLSFLGPVYSAITLSGEVFAVLIIPACLVFLARRYLLNIRRFIAREMKLSSKLDATLILILILMLMVSLLGMNSAYVATTGGTHGSFPFSQILISAMGWSGKEMAVAESVNWWIHIMLVLLFLNILPYSKHFHVIMAVPNVFLSRLEPKAKLGSMPSVTREVRLILADLGLAEQAAEEPVTAGAPVRFGVKDLEDASWKNMLDAYTCTECGRCTDVCPASNTGKLLSPRKLFIDLRARMKDKGPGLLKESAWSDGRALVGDYISHEELWACTTCMACIQECPVNIDHVPFIIDMRRYVVMEESKASPELNLMFSNIENNGAPWQFAREDRLKWAENLKMNIRVN